MRSAAHREAARIRLTRHQIVKSRPRLAFVWETFGPYHMDRCEACARHFRDHEVIGIELCRHSGIYAWEPTGAGLAFRKITLFADSRGGEVGGWRHFRALTLACLRSGAQHVFLCGYEMPQVFLAAIVLRLLGRRVIVMQDSKFDDKPRIWPKECLKALLYRPYSAALAGSPRSRAYLEFLGMARGRIALGYDAVSVERIARLADSPPAPGGLAHEHRHFTAVARFVPEKNLAAALDAYAAYCRDHAGAPRELHLCGSGALEPMLRERAARLGLSGVRFRGELSQEAVARTLATSLALLLPSIEEPFGLVVNEAVALGVPVIVSDNSGARDLLVRTGVNGYVVEPDNVEGIAHFMGVLDGDPAEWARLALNAQRFRPLADVGHFMRGVEQVLEALGRPTRRALPSFRKAAGADERPSGRGER